MEKVYLEMTYQKYIGDNARLMRAAFESMGDTEGGYDNHHPLCQKLTAFKTFYW